MSLVESRARHVPNTNPNWTRLMLTQLSSPPPTSPLHPLIGSALIQRKELDFTSSWRIFLSTGWHLGRPFNSAAAHKPYGGGRDVGNCPKAVKGNRSYFEVSAAVQVRLCCMTVFSRLGFEASGAFVITVRWFSLITILQKSNVHLFRGLCPQLLSPCWSFHCLAFLNIFTFLPALLSSRLLLPIIIFLSTSFTDTRS